MKIATQLYRRGLVSAEQLADAICVVAQRRKPIGQIALERRLLSMRQTMDVLAFQSDHPNLPFGRAAVQLDFLTEDDVTALLGIQEKQVPTLSEVLVELGYISSEMLAQEIIAQREIQLPAVAMT
ncbi:MAG: hypothetical protein Aurels2KO_00030 [Aureliella sp.]